jgi:16S rRNA (adenine1518-N6/adenine1519-N6)-dimethyltransferase
VRTKIVIAPTFAPKHRHQFVHPLQLKKSLGQHFLHDKNILHKITEAIGKNEDVASVVEIGPGMGALTQYLLPVLGEKLSVIELDNRWAAHLLQAYPALGLRIINNDVLKVNFNRFEAPIHIVGNFPYNISSQIVFALLDNRSIVTRLTGMFQKEVALRIASPPGNKDYGVLSILSQAYYKCTYLFDVPPGCFNPPPKVMSGIIRMERLEEPLGCNEVLFRKLVKQAFTQRRKTMRNSLRGMVPNTALLEKEVFNLRPEALSVQQFVELTNLIEAQ